MKIKKDKPVEDVCVKFDKLTKPKKIETLFAALGYMQQYNGRSKWDCIALALGMKPY